jgi:hypothetical protein
VSAELKDFRGKITPLAWCYLEAEARATGKDQQEILREVMHGWAARRHEAAIEAQKLMRAEGITGNGNGDGGAPK